MFNEDWYPTEQGEFLKQLVKEVQCISGSVIEIGCWEGKSTYQLANAVHPEFIICNDTWRGNEAETEFTGMVHISQKLAEQRDVYSRFVSNMDELTKGNYKIVKEDCLRWLPTLTEPVKFCHIDASHEYNSVFETIKYLKPLVVKGGILCGDDYLNSHDLRYDLDGGVMRAVKELLPEHKNFNNLWYWINH